MGHDSRMTRQLLVIVLILVSGIVPERLAGLKASSLRDSLKSNLFNRADLERMEHGYYEALLDRGRRLDDLAELPTMRVRWRSGSTWSIPVDQSPLVVRVDDLREVVLKKNDATTRFGLDWRTNSQGMRDREYSLEKPRGTFRVALVGDSIGAGWGVNAEDRFESILEELWDKRAGAIAGRKVEFINCAVPGHSPGQRWYHFGLLGWPMEPDLVIYEATAADIGWDERRLRFLLARGIGWDCPIYRAALTDAGVQPLGSPDQYKRALQPRHREILSGVYRFMAADCRAARRADLLGTRTADRTARRCRGQACPDRGRSKSRVLRLDRLDRRFRRPRRGSPHRRPRRLSSQRPGPCAALLRGSIRRWKRCPRWQRCGTRQPARKT